MSTVPVPLGRNSIFALESLEDIKLPSISIESTLNLLWYTIVSNVPKFR